MIHVQQLKVVELLGECEIYYKEREKEKSINYLGWIL